MRQVSPEKASAITAAADQLVIEGVENPTNDQVRDKMGKGVDCRH